MAKKTEQDSQYLVTLFYGEVEDPENMEFAVEYFNGPGAKQDALAYFEAMKADIMNDEPTAVGVVYVTFSCVTREVLVHGNVVSDQEYKNDPDDA